MAQKKKSKGKFIAGVFFGGIYIVMRFIAGRQEEAVNLNRDNSYLDRKVSSLPDRKSCPGYSRKGRTGVYNRLIKPVADRILSFGGLVLLAPFFAVISIAIYLDDPGPVLFTQKRVGKDRHFFQLHKFRTMKRSAPSDVPTHRLQNPEQYITKAGRVLRRTSLDELPQIWDIFRGKMSIIGPRPALWNQEDLVAEREKYGANGILPGLTGWAQINGRDELEIRDKAALDGEYAAVLNRGGPAAFLLDVKCFMGTIARVLRQDGVVEGGTGVCRGKGREFESKLTCSGCTTRDDIKRNLQAEAAGIKAADASDAGFEDYGYKKVFHIDRTVHKRVLITGANSYIGESFASYGKEHYPNLEIDTIDMIDGTWRKHDFASYDTVFHVAGIAHADVGKVSEEEKRRYYAVNTDLAVETCRKARDAGVRQFIFMSSMIVYGDSASCGREKMIDEHTMPAPANFYGDSKWQADRGVRGLQTPDFHVAVLRPPMIYGRGSRGNYPVLAKLAKRLPVFPDVRNRRSMLYIDNLCEFVSLLVLSGEGGVYFPQNREYTETADMVQKIGKTAGKEVRLSRLLNPAVTAGSKVPGKIGGLVDKAFGSSIYSQKLSVYDGLDYRVVNLKESVVLTETSKSTEQSRAEEKPRVLILVNHDVVIYNFRLELVERLLAEGYEVYISSPRGEHTEDLIALGAHHYEADIDRHGMNPKEEFRLLAGYRRLIRMIHPLVVLTYTIKPNIYGGIAAKGEGVPFITNITGLGTVVNGGGAKAEMILFLYRLGLRGARKVFFQNEENRDYMLDNHMISGSYAVLPGSGVNLKTHVFEPYPEDTDRIIFITVGRIMRDKGTDELLEAAEKVKKKYPSVVFRLIGFFDDFYEAKIRDAEERGIIEYVEQQKDIHPWMREAHAIIHPSYHEGMSNVLLEAAATGRPVLASDIPGCYEAFEEGVSGLGFKPQNSRDLVRAIEQFIQLPFERKAAMGKAGREKMEREFNREIVVEEYMNEIRRVRGMGSGADEGRACVV